MDNLDKPLQWHLEQNKLYIDSWGKEGIQLIFNELEFAEIEFKRCKFWNVFFKECYLRECYWEKCNLDICTIQNGEINELEIKNNKCGKLKKKLELFKIRTDFNFNTEIVKERRNKLWKIWISLWDGILHNINCLLIHREKKEHN